MMTPHVKFAVDLVAIDLSNGKYRLTKTLRINLTGEDALLEDNRLYSKKSRTIMQHHTGGVPERSAHLEQIRALPNFNYWPIRPMYHFSPAGNLIGGEVLLTSAERGREFDASKAVDQDRLGSRSLKEAVVGWSCEQ
jgi:hypothetical protein